MLPLSAARVVWSSLSQDPWRAPFRPKWTQLMEQPRCLRIFSCDCPCPPLYFFHAGILVPCEAFMVHGAVRLAVVATKSIFPAEGKKGRRIVCIR